MKATASPARAISSRAQSLGAHLPPLLVAAERIAATVAQGVHGRRRVGQGDSFWQFRPLLPGESASRIDWRRSARADRGHFVRQTEWEAAQTVVLWRDGAPGMRWRSGPDLAEKRERADLLLLALAALLLRGGERVRLLGASALDISGQAGLPRLASALALENASTEETPALPGAAGVPRHACVVLLSDWLEPIESTRAALATLAAQAVSGHVLQILDPAETALPYAGRVRFRGLAQNAPSALIGRAESVRDAYAERLQAHQAALAACCHAAGLGFSVHRTDHPAAAALLALHVALSPHGGLR